MQRRNFPSKPNVGKTGSTNASESSFGSKCKESSRGVTERSYLLQIDVVLVETFPPLKKWPFQQEMCAYLHTANRISEKTGSIDICKEWALIDASGVFFSYETKEQKRV